MNRTKPQPMTARAALAIVLVALALSLAAPDPAAADEPESRTVRVGFAQAEGFMMTDEQGNRTGLVVDFLNEIAKYTGWDYEYVDTDGTDLPSELANGDYDLLGGVYYAEGLERFFAYPRYSTGHSRSVLLARWDDPSVSGYNLNDLDGKTIGVNENATENIRRLKDFLSTNGLTCTIAPFNPSQMGAGGMTNFLAEGKADLVLGNASDDEGSYRPVAYFDAQPHYIVTAPGKTELLEQLDWALGKIFESNPGFADELADKYFADRGVSVSLSPEERAFVEERKTVKVVVPDDLHPFYCAGTENSMHDGIVPDLLKEMSAFSGLTFELIGVGSYEEALDAVRRGEADMAGFFLGSENDASADGLSLSRPYTTMNSLVVRNKSVSYPSDGLRFGVVAGRDLPDSIEAADVRYYRSIFEGLEAVDRGEIDCLYGATSWIENEMQQHAFHNVVAVSLLGDIDVSFAFAKPADTNLLTIANKTVTNLSDAQLEAIVGQNTVSTGTMPLTLRDLLYAHPVQTLAAVVAVLLLILTAVIAMMHSRVRTAIARSEVEEAEAASRSKSEFLSRMSHEMRTPMNAIVGLAELAGTAEGVPDDVKSDLAKLRTSSRYLLNLINDVLDMSRIDNGMLAVASEPFSLADMLDELETMMDHEAERRGIALTFTFEVAHSSLTGDVVRLRQVLTNLVSNALKFTPKGGSVELTVQEKASDDDGATFLFRVSDDGAGIAPEDHERIFGAFEQSGASLSRSEGTGLGLPISRNIVRLMGGELLLESAPGEGSTFWFEITLPYGDLRSGEAPDELDETLTGAHLLLVEDNDLNAEIAKGLLELQGAQVDRAADGLEAVELFSASEQGAFQAVLMDIRMPVMDGLDAARAIRALDRPDAAVVPIVAMTANSFQEDIDGALAAGMNGFLTKPIDVDRLYRTLRELLHD